MAINKLPEFAKDGQKNTDDLVLTDGFPVLKKPARQWFNYLFNMLSLKINELIELDQIARSEIVDNLTTNDATKPVSAKQAKVLQDNKLDKTENAVSATKLQTARKINGVDFDGSTDIDLPLIGVNQTWQNLTASRAAETIYTNTTGKPIQVAINYNGNNAYFNIGGVEIYMPDYNSFGFAFFIIPNGTTYRIRNQISINSWSELR